MSYDKPSKGIRAEDSAKGYKMDKRAPYKIETMGYPCGMDSDTPAAKLQKKLSVPKPYQPFMPSYGWPKSRYY